MLTQFSALDLDLIDEGRFRAEIEADLAAAQEAIIAFGREWNDAAKKAKARVVIKVDLIAVDPAKHSYAIKAQSHVERPARPAGVSLAVAGEEDEQLALFVRRAGSGRDSPRQRILTTEDGRRVDAETGEVIEEKAK